MGRVQTSSKRGHRDWHTAPADQAALRLVSGGYPFRYSTRQFPMPESLATRSRCGAGTPEVSSSGAVLRCTSSASSALSQSPVLLTPLSTRDQSSGRASRPALCVLLCEVPTPDPIYECGATSWKLVRESLGW